VVVSFDQLEPSRRRQDRVSWPVEAEDVAQQLEGPETRYETLAPARQLGTFASLAKGQYFVLAPGRDLEVVDGHHHPRAPAIVAGHGELFLRGGVHRSHCRTPTYRGKQRHLPLATRLVSVFVHHRPVGEVNRTSNLVFALDRHDTIVSRLDTSNSWEMSSHCLQQICNEVGLEYGTESYDFFPQMWQAHPNWVDAKVEFEVDHPAEEEVREFGMFVWWASALAILLGGGYMIAFIRSPIGPWYRALAFSGLAVATALTLWARSKTRMRRSMGRKASGGKW
jgi:hypothetical protein